MRDRLLVFIILAIFNGREAVAQNLFPNPGFEQYSVCPDKISQSRLCLGWNGWAHNTPDYFNCGYYEQDFTGYPYATPHSGTGVMGFVNISNGQFGTYTEGIIGALTQPVRAGHNYALQFQLAIASQGLAGLPSFGEELAFGFYFFHKKSRPEWNGPGGPFDWKDNSFTPQVSVIAAAIDTYDRYKGFRFCFTPAEDYDSVYVGVVSTAQTNSLPSKTYYFNLDDLSLREQADTPLRAGISANNICTGACVDLGSDDTSRLALLSLDAAGSFCTPPLHLPLRLCYDSPGRFPVSLSLRRDGSCAAFGWQDTVVVTEPIHPILPDTTLCPNQVLKVDLRHYAGSHIVWEDGDTALLKAFFATGRHTAIMQTGGCSSSAGFTLTVKDYCTAEVSVPTAFSPNGDGLNDVFRVISNYPLSNFSIRIYDRWGKSRFYHTSYKAGWDGGDADVGTYFYQISYQHPISGELVKLKGDVALVR